MPLPPPQANFDSEKTLTNTPRPSRVDSTACTLNEDDTVFFLRRSFKGTVSPDYKCLEVISINSTLLGHVTPDI